MFQELPIESSIGSFADRLKDLIKKGDWEGVGSTIGAKVNEGIKNIKWAETGKIIGTGINSAVKTAYSFLSTVDFKQIGSGIATFLNEALASIDFEFVGRLMVKPFTSILDTIIGFITTLDWWQIGKSIGDTLRGIFNEASDWLESVDWNKLGSTLYEDIKNVISGVDFPSLASSLFRFLGTAISSAASFLSSFFGSIVGDIKKWWNNDIKGADWKETGQNLLKAIGKGITGIGKFVLDSIIKPLSQALFNADWDEIVEAGGNMIDGFFTGIKNAIKGIKNWIKTHIVDPFVNFFKDLFGIHSPSTVMEEIGGYIIDGFLGGILKPLKTIGKWLKEPIVDPICKKLREFFNDPNIELGKSDFSFIDIVEK